MDKETILRLQELGFGDEEVRGSNVGTSNYSDHFIQPWSIIQDHNLNYWDGDIIKRTLRKKRLTGYTDVHARIEDYQKIIHNCKERIRQLNSAPSGSDGKE